MPRYEPLDHTADSGIIAYGADLPELFENAAFGLFDLMFDLSALHTGREQDVSVEAEGLEELLVAWLEELLFRAESEGLAFLAFSVRELDEKSLRGVAKGVSSEGVELVGPPIKAVTYHDLQVTEVDEGWQARVIFDV
ncbi:MAG: archease [Acidimicrobiia bacterium]